MDSLTSTERKMLDFEREHPRLTGARKSAAVRFHFGMGTIAYHQALHSLLDRPAAVAYAPGTVHRLRKPAREGRLAG